MGRMEHSGRGNEDDRSKEAAAQEVRSSEILEIARPEVAASVAEWTGNHVHEFARARKVRRGKEAPSSLAEGTHILASELGDPDKDTVVALAPQTLEGIGEMRATGDQPIMLVYSPAASEGLLIPEDERETVVGSLELLQVQAPHGIGEISTQTVYYWREQQGRRTISKATRRYHSDTDQMLLDYTSAPVSRDEANSLAKSLLLIQEALERGGDQ